MKNKKGFVLSILLFLFIFGVTIPLFMTNPIKAKADTITDLSNTTWIFNDNVNFNISPQSFYINFTSNNNSYRILQYVFDEDDGNMIYYIDGGVVYRDSWLDSNYKTITIVNGNDVTNSTLINWLQSNATQDTSQNGIEISKKYWTCDSVIMQDDDRIGDDDIQYKVLYNEFTDTYNNTTQTGLYFIGVQTEQTPSWSYIESINGDGINILYHGTNNTLANTMLLEFTIGDNIDTDLYNLMALNGHWFDDYDAYLYGRSRGYQNGLLEGRALGQADGTQYTGLVTGIFNGLGDLLSIQVFPNITIGLLIGLPLLLGAFVIIIKILRG